MVIKVFVDPFRSTFFVWMAEVLEVYNHNVKEII